MGVTRIAAASVVIDETRFVYVDIKCHDDQRPCVQYGCILHLVQSVCESIIVLSSLDLCHSGVY